MTTRTSRPDPMITDGQFAPQEISTCFEIGQLGVLMNYSTRTLPSRSRPGVVLEGGPMDFPTEMRRRKIVPADSKIIIPHRGWYEHFELADSTSDPDGMAPAIFRWTMHTRIAE